jgi:hypothetical protein
MPQGRCSSYAALNLLPHVTSYGELPVVVYQQSKCGRHHGNFSSLPAKDGLWRELDSSLRSDALLMNIFCYPGVRRRTEVCRMLGLEPGSLSAFGFMPRVPLFSEATERTEIDMKLGNVLFEAKLTEADFQIQRAELVEQYRDLRDVFECRRLPRANRKYVSHQLIRHVLAAHALGLDFCALLDARRPDLLEDWFLIVRCIRSATLRARCKILTWQELAFCLPGALKNFLRVKYGIVPAAEMHQSAAGSAWM